MTKRTTTAVAVETRPYSNSNEAAMALIDAGLPLPDSQPKARKAKTQRPCGCGCGLVGAGEFRPGHDAVLKGRLLAEARSGNQASRDELIRRGWATDESIDNPKGKRTDAERAERQRLRLAAKLDQARAAVADLEAQLAGL